MTAVRIEVTADDIRRGHKSDACECPVALAMIRALRCPVVAVGPVDAAIEGANVEIPERVISDFDHGRPVEPFGFDIEIPGELAPAVTP